MHFEEHGGGNPGPPLVFVHGAGGNRLHWPPGLRRLAGFRTLAVDLPGHGLSPTGGEGRVLDFAGRLDAWRGEVGLHLPVLIGHSMGSAIALTCALAEPGAFSGLVLIGAGARLKVNPDLLDSVGRPDQFLTGVEMILRWSFAAGAKARLVEMARARLIETGPAVLAADLQSCAAFDVTSHLAEIRTPALILVGQEDRMTPPPLSRELQTGIAGARLNVIEDAGHMLMLEQPEAVARHLQSFLLERPRFEPSPASAKGDER
jgi:pimeloyl-ACP methyl ester carboxylesterase